MNLAAVARAFGLRDVGRCKTHTRVAMIAGGRYEWLAHSRRKLLLEQAPVPAAPAPAAPAPAAPGPAATPAGETTVHYIQLQPTPYFHNQRRRSSGGLPWRER
ncbi:hypothetical protein ETR14_12660 [Sphingosinicella sp. BN140058]|nr:hypothetical protein ETR14_12660 [Sphingosinicella sp. BN140058]